MSIDLGGVVDSPSRGKNRTRFSQQTSKLQWQTVDKAVSMTEIRREDVNEPTLQSEL